MRSLEIRTERIFNNLIKQNQKLAADFVLKQSKIVSSAQSPTSSVKSPRSSAQSPASSVQSSASRVQHREFSVQGSEFNVQRPESSVQSPTSNSCVQSPGILVCQNLTTLRKARENICEQSSHGFLNVVKFNQLLS